MRSQSSQLRVEEWVDKEIAFGRRARFTFPCRGAGAQRHRGILRHGRHFPPLRPRGEARRVRETVPQVHLDETQGLAAAKGGPAHLQ